MNWKELQQMAKEFDREVRKERQGAGEHRADAVGLLTPALLRKHIKSGTVHRIGHGLRIFHPLVTDHNLHSISHPPGYRHTDLSGTRKQHYFFFHITHF